MKFIFNDYNEKISTVTNSRIMKASMLLPNVHFSIKEVAYAAGFNCPKYFARCFKRVTGLTPVNYRRAIISSTSGTKIEEVNNTFISQAKHIIDNNLSNDHYNPDHLASDLNISKSTLYRRIKAITNYSTIEFINAERINTGAQLLKSDHYRVSEVAYMVGFNDPKYFCKCFKTKLGLSPLNYKKLFKNEYDYL
jgi:AraC-like DNA-binding protein